MPTVTKSLSPLLNYTTLKLENNLYYLSQSLSPLLNYTTLKHEAEDAGYDHQFESLIKLHYS